MERDGHAYLDSETTFGGWNLVPVEQFMAFSSSNFSEAWSFGPHPSSQPDSGPEPG